MIGSLSRFCKEMQFNELTRQIVYDAWGLDPQNLDPKLKEAYRNAITKYVEWCGFSNGKIHHYKYRLAVIQALDNPPNS